MAEKNKTFLVAGLGRFGMAVCERLTELEQSVIAVDRNRIHVEAMADTVDIAAQLDITDEDALVKAGAREVDAAVVAVGDNIEASVLATAILVGMKVPYVMARAQNALHGRVLARVGASRVFFPERDLGRRVADQMVYPSFSGFTMIPGKGFLVGEVSPLPDMPGKSLAELEFRKRYNAVILLVDRNGGQFLPSAETVIREDDRLLIAGPRESLTVWLENGEDGDAEIGR